jgi:hypothetical protein
MKRTPLKQRDKPLRRQSRLKTFSDLARDQVALSTRGPRTVANEAARAVCWPKVKRRAHYRCENCKEALPLEWSHVAGRPGSGATLGPWSNTVELTQALCHLCHQLYDGYRMSEPERSDLQLRAAKRLAKRVPGGGAAIPPQYRGYPLDWIRGLVRGLEQQGIEP